MSPLNDAQAKKLCESRGQQWPKVIDLAARVAWDTIRSLRINRDGDDPGDWRQIDHADRERWRQRAAAVARGEVTSVRELYIHVLDLKQDDAITRAWEGVQDRRLSLLAIEFTVYRFVLAPTLPEGVGPVLQRLRFATIEPTDRPQPEQQMAS